MKNVLLHAAMKLNMNRKARKRWQRFVRLMGMVVVFCTTYALILPAITMDQEPICGIEAHAHGADCYLEKAVYSYACGLEAGVTVIHTHDALCYDDEGVLICQIPELREHTHGEECYTRQAEPVCEFVHVHSDDCLTLKPVLVCGLEETAGHTHSEACTTETVLICTEAESEGHTHTDDCGSTETVLICTEEEGESHTHGDACYETKIIPCPIPESAGHTHGEGCYETREVTCPVQEHPAHTHSEACYEEQEVYCDETTNDGHVHEDACYPLVLSCTQEEVKLHTHETACFDAEENLICTLPQVVAHAHSDACRTRAEEPVLILICQTEEHSHDVNCYPVEQEENEEYEFICGNGVHTHVEGCYDEAGELICTIPEHTHDASCLVEDLDLTADVETEEQWKETFSSVIPTGNWPTDVVAVAKTQLGYRESRKNLVLSEGGLKGYTRYGAWYGDAYGDWSAMFASFCLHYAGVENFPLDSDVNSWITALEEKQLYKTPEAYAPKPGDLIFFDFDRKADAPEDAVINADHVGIVTELIPATEEHPAQVKLICGDREDQVGEMTCSVDDIAIIGYADMPAGHVIFLNYAGEDFTVKATLGVDALIPDSAQLAVREILPGTEEYDGYYQQTVENLMGGLAEGEEVPALSFARFFDIQFLVNGVAAEPAVPVDIQIHYSSSVAVMENENGIVVNIGQEGVEFVDSTTYRTETSGEEDGVLQGISTFFGGTEAEQVDTFRFRQDSSSVSGTIVTFAARAVGDTYYYREPTGLDVGGGTQYLFYAKANNGRYYAIYSGPGSGADTARPVEITFDENGAITTEISNYMLWTLSADGNAYIIRNVGSGKYLHCFDNNTGESITTNGGYATSMLFSSDGEDVGFLFQSNSDYAQFNGSDFTVGQSANAATTFFMAAPRGSQSGYHVWFDGTNGGLMNLYGSPNTYQAVSANNNVITLPSTWESPAKYPYALNGWYDIIDNIYYAPGEQVTITQNTVFYADWMAASYDVGQSNSHVVNSVDTSDFITTYVFDYNTLFNVQSLAHIGSISANGHSEQWTILNSGKVPYNNADTLGFMFVDYDAGGDFSYAHGRDTTNVNQGSVITPGIIAEVADASGKDLLDLLFNPNTPVIGKKYVGTGNYLFQYMDSTTSNYDGIHDGYYYLDARLNAASYNQSAQRFYLYDYLERTSDSAKDGGVGQYSDFLPFNSPYQFRGDQVDAYTDSIARPGYEYDAKDGVSSYQNYNSADDAITNYFFGIRTDIEFFLPNDAGDQDEYGNYGNISTRGEHMIFDFHGDDDVWVFVDGKLMLDIGGLHGVMFGQIDFSSGTVIVGQDGGATTESRFNLSEGTHTMTVYYMERGSSQSNCAIYFNIAPRYDLEIRKEDVFTAQMLNGTEFSIYTDEACTHPAQLWTSEEAHKADMEDGVVNDATNTFVVTNGTASCWGVSAGKTYYIKETKAPDGYPNNDDIIRITLNNRGTATIETTTLLGGNLVATEGYAVIEQDVNDTLKIVALTVTNQKDTDTTQIRVKKVWDAQATDLPNSITAYLMVDGVRVGRPAVLTEANGWTYTWTGLPKFKADGETLIEYEIGEIQVSGFNTEYVIYKDMTAYVEWVKTSSMEDSTTYLLMNGGRALAYNGTGFYWMDQAAAQNEETGLDAQWYVSTNQYGFRLRNGRGYNLTYDPDTDTFYGTTDTQIALNQVIYYLGGRLVAHDHDRYYQMDLNGTAVSSDGLVFSLIRKDMVSGMVAEIKNTLMENEEQTFVEVSKVWADSRDHSGDSVTMHLYANGVDTGRTVILSEATGWKGVFEGLPYTDAEGNVIKYTVKEDEPEDYDAKYEYEDLPGKQIVTWIKQTELTSGGIFRIVNGASAMAIDPSGALTVAVNDPADQNQWWTAVTNNGRIVLKAVNSNAYLYADSSGVSLVTRASGASSVVLTDETITVNGYYLQMFQAGMTVSRYAYNATLFTVAMRTEGEGKPGTGVTVTNVDEVKYQLPVTGGMGTSHLTFGGFAVLAAALMYISIPRRIKRKGGKYIRK